METPMNLTWQQWAGVDSGCLFVWGRRSWALSSLHSPVVCQGCFPYSCYLRAPGDIWSWEPRNKRHHGWELHKNGKKSGGQICDIWGNERNRISPFVWHCNSLFNCQKVPRSLGNLLWNVSKIKWIDGGKEGWIDMIKCRGMSIAESKWWEDELSGYNSFNFSVCLIIFRKKYWPWLVWLSGLSASLQIKGSLVRFPVRAHAWVAGQVPTRVAQEGTTYGCFSPSLFLSLPLSLKLNI